MGSINAKKQQSKKYTQGHGCLWRNITAQMFTKKECGFI
jgi:hypothetical protein